MSDNRGILQKRKKEIILLERKESLKACSIRSKS